VIQNDVAELADTGPEESAVVGHAIKLKSREPKSFCTINVLLLVLGRAQYIDPATLSANAVAPAI
jgi:hypothetical protein